jgi:hypothetical protein
MFSSCLTMFQPSFSRILILFVYPASPVGILLWVLCAVAASSLFVGAFGGGVWCCVVWLFRLMGVITGISVRNLPTRSHGR